MPRGERRTWYTNGKTWHDVLGELVLPLQHASGHLELRPSGARAEVLPGLRAAAAHQLSRHQRALLKCLKLDDGATYEHAAAIIIQSAHRGRYARHRYPIGLHRKMAALLFQNVLIHLRPRRLNELCEATERSVDAHEHGWRARARSGPLSRPRGASAVS